MLFTSASKCNSENTTKKEDTKTRVVSNFTAKASNNKTYTLENELKKNDGVFLYFIKSTCPMNAKAIPFVEQLYKAYPKTPFFGVINMDNTDGLFDAWQKKFNAPYPVLYDDSLTIIKDAGAQRSPYIVQLNKKREVVKFWKGYSQEILKEVGDAMAKVGKVKVKKIDFSKAPEKTKFGCPFVH